jgi:hypothetical protein
VRFAIEQHFTSDADAIARAYADPELYRTFAGAGLQKLRDADVLSHTLADDRVVLEVRYRFGGALSPAVTAVIDPSRLTWVERSVHDLATRQTTFAMHPDHYADRFRCAGSYRFVEAEGGSRRIGEGEAKVKALLVGGAVEGAIVSGLKEHLVEEIPVVEAFVAG